jgi:phosphomannomutase/phosphoglucomutase
MSIFREYDIRGIVGKDLTMDCAESIGRAYATLATRRNCGVVTVGRDGRLTSPDLHNRLVTGLLAGGLDVIDLGLCASPLLYFSLFHLQVDGGVMITGSHNSAEYNGFKSCIGKEALHGAEIQELKAIMDSRQFSSGSGTLTPSVIIPHYLEFLQEHFSSVDGRSLHVVIDCGNGAASLVAKQALEQLGCRVTGLYCELDGRFPNHHPDPTVVDNLHDLIAAVKREGADLGIGYDGDADRIGAIDEKGGILWGDRLLLIFSRDLLQSQPGSTIISEVKASQQLYDDIAQRGGRGVMWKTGHSVLKAKMKEEGALLAGEMSGHMFFADRYFGYDDAIYASCRLIEILTNTKKTVSALLADLPNTSVTPEIRVDCPDDLKFRLADQIRDRFLGLAKNPEQAEPGLLIRDVVTIDGIRVRFDHGWGLLRASNTQPALVLRFEADTDEWLKTIQSWFERELETVRNQFEL